LASMRGRLVVGAAAMLAVGAIALALALTSGGSNTNRRASVAHLASGARRHTAASGAVAAPAHGAANSGHVNVLATPPGSSHCQNAAPSVPERPISQPQWLSGVTITEYYPSPESWFAGRRVTAPGLPGTYAADWLYSARGLAMEGSGVDRNGRPVHIAELGSTGWVNAAGRPTVPVCLGKWSNGFPVWLIGGWRNGSGAVTFPLASGGWSNGTGARTFPYGGVTFAPEQSTPLVYYHSIAVDPRLIPLGSHVYVPAYRQLGGGWFIAQDTGGAIKGRHIDVYRPPPPTPADLGRYMTGQRILVIPPK
jgi:3D (Asp-Asp-Asp) domain-containing protein